MAGSLNGLCQMWVDGWVVTVTRSIWVSAYRKVFLAFPKYLPDSSYFYRTSKLYLKHNENSGLVHCGLIR